MSSQINTGIRRHAWTVFSAVLAAGVLPAAALDVTPKAIYFDTLDTVAHIDVKHNGQPVEAAGISSVKLYVDAHDYDHMIETSTADGQVTVRPSDMLEIGSYKLVIDTRHGQATVNVSAPLDRLYDSLASRAERLGLTEEELKARLGGARQAIGREYVDLGLPKVYYVGQTLSVPIERKSGRTYTWSVNGEMIEVGAGEAQMRYTFKEPGVYDFTYVEKEGERVVATGFGATSAVPEPPVRLAFEAGSRAQLAGPAGYTRYTWEVDGNPVEAKDTLVHTFEQPGAYEITVRAHEPRSETVAEFRVVTFIVNVS